MELLSKEQIRQYIKEGNLKDLNDVQSMIKDLFASTVQERAAVLTTLGILRHLQVFVE
jgi:hypothetical protein